MDYIGAFEHFSLRLNERFNENITYDEYVRNLILKRTLPSKLRYGYSPDDLVKIKNSKQK